MENINQTSYQKAGGRAAIAGSILMFIGAALWGSSGTDLWMALRERTMRAYLADAGQAKALLTANIPFWIAGVIVLTTAGKIMADISGQSGSAVAAKVSLIVGAPLAVISFITMLALVIQIAPDISETSVAIANVIGWIGARADDLATALIIGFFPIFISIAGQNRWVPKWLLIWGYMAGFFGLLSLIVLYIPSLAALGMIIIPVGLGWMIAAGIILIKRN